MDTEEIITAIRAALAPGADSTTKQRAAALVRPLLVVLDAQPGTPLVVAPVAPPPVPRIPDLLGALVEKFRPMLPTDAQATIRRLDIPLVTMPPKP